MNSVFEKQQVWGWILIVMMLAAGGTGYAQDLPATTMSSQEEPIILDWDTAWEMAVDYNEQLKIARNEQRKARLQVLEAYSAAMPTISAEGMLNHYFEVPKTEVTFGGVTQTFAFSQENVINASAQLTQPLWLAGKVGLGLKAAKTYQEIAKMSVDVSRQDLRVQLVEAFYGALIAEEFVDVAEQALEQAQKHRNQVQSMLNEGVVSEYDLIRSDVAVSNLKPQVVEAKTAYDLSRKGLMNLLGIEFEREIQLRGTLDDVILKPDMTFETASDYAVDQRVEMKQLTLQRKLYEVQEKVEKRNWLWPNFLAGLRWETTAQTNKWNFQEERFFSGASGQLMINIPLFDGFASHRRAQIAEVNQRNVDLQKSQLKRGIKLQVLQAMRQYELASEKLEAALENRRQAEKGYDIAQTRYAGGVGTQLEILDAQLQLNSSRVNVLQATYDQMVARAEYDRALGVEWDPTVDGTR